VDFPFPRWTLFHEGFSFLSFILLEIGRSVCFADRMMRRR